MDKAIQEIEKSAIYGNLDYVSEKVKFEVYGQEMIEKMVKRSGNSARIYLPQNWIGHTVKIVKI